MLLDRISNDALLIWPPKCRTTWLRRPPRPCPCCVKAHWNYRGMLHSLVPPLEGQPGMTVFTLGFAPGGEALHPLLHTWGRPLNPGMRTPPRLRVAPPTPFPPTLVRLGGVASYFEEPPSPGGGVSTALSHHKNSGDLPSTSLRKGMCSIIGRAVASISATDKYHTLAARNQAHHRRLSAKTQTCGRPPMQAFTASGNPPKDRHTYKSGCPCNWRIAEIAGLQFQGKVGVI